MNLSWTYRELIMNLSWTYRELTQNLSWTYHELIMTWWLTKAEKQLWPNHSITSFVNIPIVNILLLVKLRQSLMFFHGFCSYVFEQRNGGWWFFFLLLVVSENEGRPTTASEWELHMIFVLWYRMYSTTVTGNKLLCQTYLSCLLPPG